jgi:uncharacterized protein YprB with RNaseH-like and TPR domain
LIRRTFRHVHGIGGGIERALWSSGLTTWEAAAASDVVVPRVGRLAPHAAASLAAWEARDFAYFAPVTSGSEAWRWYGVLRRRCLYLDIETTGLGREYDVVTVVSCYDGQDVTLFVRDDNLADFPFFLGDFDLLVTYNGAGFDVPFLKHTWPHLHLPPVHLDLRHPLHSLGYRGGLKGIEQATGLGRDSELLAVDGYMAVKLWHAHQRGDARALPTLLRYAAEDVLGLEPLAHLVYNAKSAEMQPPVEPLPDPVRRGCDLPWHPEVVAALSYSPS